MPSASAASSPSSVSVACLEIVMYVPSFNPLNGVTSTHQVGHGRRWAGGGGYTLRQVPDTRAISLVEPIDGAAEMSGPGGRKPVGRYVSNDCQEGPVAPSRSSIHRRA